MSQCHEVQLVCSTNEHCTGMQFVKHFASMPLAVRRALGKEAGHMSAVTFLPVVSKAMVASADG